MSDKPRFTFKYRFNFKDRTGGSLQVSSLPDHPNEFPTFEEFENAVRVHAESFIKKAREMTSKENRQP